MEYVRMLPAEYILVIFAIASGSGVYGILILYNLKSRIVYNSQEKNDKFIIGTFNIAISFISICIITTGIMQIDTYMMLKDVDNLLHQIK